MSPEAEAKRYIDVHMLTFSDIKIQDLIGEEAGLT